MARKVADRIEQDLRFRCAKAFLGGERAEYANGAHSSAARHFDVFRGVSHVDAMFGAEAHAFERELQWCRMWFPFRRVFAAHTCGEVISERKFPDLAANSRAIAAADNAELEFCRERAQDASGAGQQRRPFDFVGSSPETVGIQPLRARKLRRAIDAEPIRGIMRGDFTFGPVDVQGAEHGKISANVGGVGIEQRAIPVEKNGASGELSSSHG